MAPRKMTKRTTGDHARDLLLNAPDVPVEQKERELEGRREQSDQTAYLNQSDIEGLGALSVTEVQDEGELEGGASDDLDNDTESLDMLTELELRDGETDDPLEAIQEGFTYIPPIDPPTVPTSTGMDGDAMFANGFGLSSLDEPYDEDHHPDLLPNDDEMTARVREAIRADSSTTVYADKIRIRTVGGVVTLRGIVDDMIDSDNLLAVADYVNGVEEVIDELRLRQM